MNFRRVAFAGLLSVAAMTAAALPANAAIVFAGSWEVDSGPHWDTNLPTGQLAYTGQEAAALLFGGTASQYEISTVNNNAADINHMAWYSVIGYDGNQGNGGSLLADNYVSKYLGQYYGPPVGYPDEDPTAAASAYINDNAMGADFTNFAFRVGTVPEPATWAMLILGFGGIGLMLRQARKRQAQTA
jgi:hypothetical protein